MEINLRAGGGGGAGAEALPSVSSPGRAAIANIRTMQELKASIAGSVKEREKLKKAIEIVRHAERTKERVDKQGASQSSVALCAFSHPLTSRLVSHTHNSSLSPRSRSRSLCVCVCVWLCRFMRMCVVRGAALKETEADIERLSKDLEAHGVPKEAIRALVTANPASSAVARSRNRADLGTEVPS